MLCLPYRELSRFAGNLATCYEAGLDLEQSLRTSGRSLARTKWAASLDTAVEEVRQGTELWKSLAAADGRWPGFFIQILRAGEESGRLDESFRYLERHCLLLDGPARAAQNAWLLPLGILLAGTALELAASLVFGSLRGTF